MKMTINAGIMLEMFKNYDRNYFTWDGCNALIDYYDEINPDYDFDVIGVCCDWNEYGETPCLKWSDLLNNYSYILEDVDGVEEMTEDEKIDALIEELEEKTTIIRLTESVLIAAF